MLQILELVGDAGFGALELFDAFLTAGYGASAGKVDYELRRARHERAGAAAQLEEETRLTRRYYNTLALLKRDGLIEVSGGLEERKFKLTFRGKTKLARLREDRGRLLPQPKYGHSAGDRFVIVTFDIPELQKNKRVWLRAALCSMEFRMLQKSVWVGKIKIPEQFIVDLRRLKLIEYVEVFEITKTGSMKHVT